MKILQEWVYLNTWMRIDCLRARLFLALFTNYPFSYAVL
eukprot:UN15230